jgi:hypothetical protein
MGLPYGSMKHCIMPWKDNDHSMSPRLHKQDSLRTNNTLASIQTAPPASEMGNMQDAV